MVKHLVRVCLVILVLCLVTFSFNSSAITFAASGLQTIPENEFVSALVYDEAFLTLDPALAYNVVSSQIIQQIYETLITFNREKTDEFIPQLASSWQISADGTEYVFHIRPGVSFHGGQSLTAGDVAYTFQRGILLGGSESPQWLLTEPILGAGITDITGIVDNYASVDNRDSLKFNDPAVLSDACDTVVSKIVADNYAGTVTFKLTQPWSPFLVTLAESWGSILDKQWVTAQGGWDGTCATWQNFYAMQTDEDPLTRIANGTGPFSLNYWTDGLEIGLLKHPEYWRTTAMWEGGPSGLAKFDIVTIKKANDAYEAVDMLINGSADYADVGWSNYASLDSHVLLKYNADGNFKSMGEKDGTLLAYEDMDGIAAQFFLFNYAISETSAFIGSGTWGTGIPVNFFTDNHVRKAFNYAFNWEQLIDEVYGGYAIQTYGPIIRGLPGHSDDQPHYTYNPSLAADEFGLAFDGAVAANGFSMGCVYSMGNLLRQTFCEILESEIEALAPSKYHITVLGMTWQDYQEEQNNGRLPILWAGWQQDIPHPHNWVEIYLRGIYAKRQNLPQDMVDKYSEKIDACLGLLGTEARVCYEDIQTTTFADALDIFGAQYLTQEYFNAAVKGYFYNPGYAGPYFYALSKSIETDVISVEEPTDVSFADEQRNQVSFTVPAYMLQDSVRHEILPDIITQPLGGGLMTSDLAFNIQGYLVSDGRPFELFFDPPIPFTITYAESPIIESTLRLFYWNGTDWEDAACAEYARDPETNTLIVPICHFSQFQLGGETNWGYLPAILR